VKPAGRLDLPVDNLAEGEKGAEDRCIGTAEFGSSGAPVAVSSGDAVSSDNHKFGTLLLFYRYGRIAKHRDPNGTQSRKDAHGANFEVIRPRDFSRLLCRLLFRALRTLLD
jgi:hypothetical protein